MVIFLYVKVPNLSASICTAETLGEGTADATSKVNPQSVDSLAGGAVGKEPEIAASDQLLEGF
jgi:hypothetical protein